jgi:hypothetical protein
MALISHFVPVLSEFLHYALQFGMLCWIQWAGGFPLPQFITLSQQVVIDVVFGKID